MNILNYCKHLSSQFISVLLGWGVGFFQDSSKFSHCCGQLLLPDPAGSKAVLVFADCFRYCVRLEIVAVPHEGRWPSIIHIILLMVMIV